MCTVNSIHKLFVYWAVAVQSNTCLFPIQTRFFFLWRLWYTCQKSLAWWEIAGAVYSSNFQEQRPGYAKNPLVEGNKGPSQVWTLRTNIRPDAAIANIKAGRTKGNRQAGIRRKHYWKQVEHSSAIDWVELLHFQNRRGGWKWNAEWER